MKFNADKLEVFTVGVPGSVAVVELTDQKETVDSGDQIEFLVKEGFRPLYESWIDDSRHALSTANEELVSVQVVRFPSQRDAPGMFKIGSPMSKEILKASKQSGAKRPAPIQLFTRKLRQFLFLG